MTKYKVSQNFWLHEFIPKEIYEKFGEKSLWFIDKRIIDVAQALRDISKKSVIINNWFDGGDYNFSGYRPPDCKVGAFYSQHKFGRAADCKVDGMTPVEVKELIIATKFFFMKMGLTTMENTDATPTWNHLDCRYTTLKDLLIVSP